MKGDYLTDVYYLQIRDKKYLVSYNIIRLFPKSLLRSLFPSGFSLHVRYLCLASEIGFFPIQNEESTSDLLKEDSYITEDNESLRSSSSAWSSYVPEPHQDMEDQSPYPAKMQYPYAKKLSDTDPLIAKIFPRKLILLESGDPDIFWFMTQYLLFVMLRNERIYSKMVSINEKSLSSESRGKQTLTAIPFYQGLGENALDPSAVTFQRQDSGTVLPEVRWS